MRRAVVASAVFLVAALAHNNAWACREGARSLPAEVGSDNARLIASADHIVIGRVSEPRRDGDRVRAQIEPDRVLRGAGRSITFEDASLPSTCSPIASRRLGSLREGVPVLILERDGADGFSILIDLGGLLVLEADDLIALIEPDVRR